ncbi:MAG: MFS transporter [Dysgonamonadaceae bacterium]|nr:MFS transporter [Dysgonamonadaceae bacterium]
MKTKELDIQPNKALLVLCMSAFLVPFMGSALNLALPEIGKTFSLDVVTLTWTATAYLLSSAIFQIPFARWADLIGRKKVYTLGVFIFSVTTFLCGLATSGEMLIVLRFLAGMGSAMLFGTNTAILTSIFPANQRGKALGINTSVVYLSLAAGPFLGGFLTHYWGWQSIFYVSAAVGFVVVLLSFFFLKGEWIEAKGEKFDYIGSIVYGLGLLGLIYGFTQLPDWEGFLFLGIGMVLFLFFAYYERRYTSPVFNVNLISKNRIFALSSLSALINYAATSAVAFMLSLYLQYIGGFDARTAGLILISQACIQSVFSLISGRLSDKIPPSVLATMGMSIIVVGLTGMIFISPEMPVSVLIVFLVLLGIGFGIFSSPNTNVIMSSVEKKYYGQASATMGTMRLTGQAFSMGIAGMTLSLFVGGKKITPEVHPDFMKSLHITFIIFVLLCVIGIYASAQRTKP